MPTENSDGQCPFPLQQRVLPCTALGSTREPRQTDLYFVIEWLMAVLTCSVAARWWFRLLPVITAIWCTLNSSCVCPSTVHLLPARSSFLLSCDLLPSTQSCCASPWSPFFLLDPARREIRLLGQYLCSGLNVRCDFGKEMRVFLNPGFKKQDVKITVCTNGNWNACLTNVYPVYLEGSVNLRLVFQSLWRQNQVQILLRSDFHVWTYSRISYSSFLKAEKEKSWDILSSFGLLAYGDAVHDCINPGLIHLQIYYPYVMSSCFESIACS